MVKQFVNANKPTDIAGACNLCDLYNEFTEEIKIIGEALEAATKANDRKMIEKFSNQLDRVTYRRKQVKSGYDAITQLLKRIKQLDTGVRYKKGSYIPPEAKNAKTTF